VEEFYSKSNQGVSKTISQDCTLIWPQPVHRAFTTTSPTVTGGDFSASSSLTRTDAERPHTQLSQSTWLWIVDNLVPSLFNMTASFD
jgi:hypothetical protein